MTEVIKTLSIDLARKCNNRIVFAVQNDFASRKLKFVITNDGAHYPLEAGATATVGILRPDGESAAYYAEIGEDGCVSFTIPLWALSVVGEVKCNLIIFDGEENRISSSGFSLEVEEVSYLGDDISDDDSYPLLVSLMNEIGEIKNAEAGREESEHTRAVNEQTREANERAREADEQTREANEALRDKAEAGRVSAELARESAENSRQANEALRESAENSRQANEALRESAENSRQANEALRESAENSRQTSEALRESAEAQREQSEIERNNKMSDKLSELEEIKEQYGYIDNALDAIIEIQNSLIGGEN